ncbi:MAG: PaaI family thioesterase [Chloroflexi bacterium]|nr:PaaI family thioesterase [Chloroflexota bacterium]
MKHRQGRGTTIDTGFTSSRKGGSGALSPDMFANRRGLELLCGMLRGELPHPPMAETLDFVLEEVEEGRVVFLGSPRPSFYNSFGSVHGGWQAALLDTCMACAVWTVLPAGTIHSTVEIKVNYLRPVFEATGVVRAEGRIIQKGQRIVTAEGRLVDGSGKIYAHGSSTFLLSSSESMSNNGKQD